MVILEKGIDFDTVADCGADSSFVPPLVYAVFGSSRDIAIGPVAVVSLLLGTLLKQEISPTENPEDYLKLAFTATFFCGVFQTGLGVFRLGFVTEFLSHASIVGFMAGAAITIALQQLKGLLNITHFTTDTDIVSVMKSVFTNIDEVHHSFLSLATNTITDHFLILTIALIFQWNWRSIVIGLAFLAFLIGSKMLVSSIPSSPLEASFSLCKSFMFAIVIVAGSKEEETVLDFGNCATHSGGFVDSARVSYEG